MRSIQVSTASSVKRTRTRAVALIAAVMLLALSLGAGTAVADGGQRHGDVHNTFTKWVTTWPAMAGVDGGAVGPGAFAGEVLKYTPGTTTVIEALYHFTGSRHAFSALVHVEQTGMKAVITGVVTDGWLKGSPVEGKYTQVTCAHDGTSTDCFRGTLDILRGSGG
jgi:hypothetical protein